MKKLKIKNKIESKGIPFYKWSGIATNRGVTTGANKIFIIDTATKEKICSKDPNSLEIIKGFLEPSLQTAKVEDRFQFQRLGYFCVDKDSSPSNLVFNKTVGLRDTWAKIESKE